MIYGFLVIFGTSCIWSFINFFIGDTKELLLWIVAFIIALIMTFFSILGVMREIKDNKIESKKG